MKFREDRKTITFLMCGALAGCTSPLVPSTSHLAPEASDRPWRPSTSSSSAVSSSPGPHSEFELPLDSALPFKHDVVPIDSNHVYDLAELIDLAERSNPETRIAWEQSRQAAFAVGAVASTYLPQLTAEVIGGAQRTPVPVPTSVEPRGWFRTDTAEILPSLVVKWLLFDFGRRDAELEAATQISTASNVAFTAAHQKLIFEVSKAYFTLAAEREQLRVAEVALKNSQTLQDATEAKNKQGLGTVTEGAIARQRTAKAQYDLAQARAADNDAYHSLLEAMGITPTLKLQIAGGSHGTFPQSISEDVDVYIKHALTSRADINGALAKLRAGEAAIKGAEADNYPTIGVEGLLSQNLGSLSIDGGPTYRVDEPASGFLVKLSLPLFDGGKRDSALRIANSKSEAAKEELAKIQDAAIQQVARAYDTLKSALAQYDSSRALVKASDTAYSAALDSYKNGIETFTNVVTAETAKSQGESAQASAHSSVLTAAAALAFASGELTSTDALNQAP